jgi:hypothetical protein
MINLRKFSKATILLVSYFLLFLILTPGFSYSHDHEGECENSNQKNEECFICQFTKSFSSFPSIENQEKFNFFFSEKIILSCINIHKDSFKSNLSDRAPPAFAF